MSLKSVLTYTLQYLIGLSKLKLVQAIDVLRKRYFALESENRILKQELERYKVEEEKRKIKSVDAGLYTRPAWPALSEAKGYSGVSRWLLSDSRRTHPVS